VVVVVVVAAAVVGVVMVMVAEEVTVETAKKTKILDYSRHLSDATSISLSTDSRHFVFFLDHQRD
jgi:Na+/H+-dicarboxylate symporter